MIRETNEFDPFQKFATRQMNINPRGVFEEALHFDDRRGAHLGLEKAHNLEEDGQDNDSEDDGPDKSERSVEHFHTWDASCCRTIELRHAGASTCDSPKHYGQTQN